MFDQIDFSKKLSCKIWNEHSMSGKDHAKEKTRKKLTTILSELSNLQKGMELRKIFRYTPQSYKKRVSGTTEKR